MTILDIAKSAGVSKSTVSRVINDAESASPEAVARVRAAMQAIGYTPPARRRGPKPRARASTRLQGTSLGFLLMGRSRELLTYPSMTRMFSGMIEELGADNIHLTVVEAPDPLVLPAIVAQGGIDGLIVTGQLPTPAFVDRFCCVPCVWTGGSALHIPIVDQVVTGHYAMGVLAADYLRRRGCRHPAFINHDPLHPVFPVLWRVFAEQIEQAGMMAERFAPESPSTMDYESIRNESAMWTAANLREGLGQQLDRALAAKDRPDGLFIPTDQQASMVWSLLIERGLVPGRDVVTVSGNNDTAWLATMHPRPATIDPHHEDVGREAVRRLLLRMKHPFEGPRLVTIAPTLVDAPPLDGSA